MWIRQGFRDNLRLLSSFFALGLVFLCLQAQAKHYVITVPGIGCNYAGCMGALASEMKRHLVQAKVAGEYQILDFHYPKIAAGQPELDTYALAKSLGEFMNQKFGTTNPLAGTDTISLVGYSQGGLVALLWLQHAYRNHEGYFPKYRSWIKNFVTLSTPFWGTEIAHLGAMIKRSGVKLISNKIQFSSVQLTEMSALSHTMFRFRVKATDEDYRSLNKTIFSSIRTLSVGGSLGQSPRAFAFSNLKTLETDLTVPLPSAHPNIIFADVEAASGTDTVQENQFQRMNTVPVKVIRAVHAAVPHLKVPAIHEQGSGSAQIIVEHLLGKNQTRGWESTVGAPRRMQAQVTVDFPKSLNLSAGDVLLQMAESLHIPLLNKSVNAAIEMDPLSLSVVRSDDIRASSVEESADSIHFNYTATGSLKEGLPSVLVLKLKVRGQEDRILRLPVEAGMTTYLRLRN